MAEAAPVRPVGRSLADFGELLPAEKTLLECSRCGEAAVICDERPEHETDDNRVRAAFVRFLALGGDDSAPVHEHGIDLQGAWLSGVLELAGATVDHRLMLSACRIEWINARHSSLKFLSLHNSHLMEGLLGDPLYCKGGLYLREGFHATGPVELIGAAIDGDVDCSGSTFENSQSYALSFDRATISGNLFLRDGFHAIGRVSLIGIKLGGELDCRGGYFENGGDKALLCQHATISRSVFLARGFHATGEVSLFNATVGGNLNCRGGRFDNGRHVALSCSSATIAGSVFLSESFHATGQVDLIAAKIGRNLECIGGRFELIDGRALSCSLAQVAGAFVFHSIEGLRGGVDLTATHVDTFCDEVSNWTGARGRLELDGFTFNRLKGSGQANARIDWLCLQPPSDLGNEFRPQPWEQLASALRAMGHPEEARDIAIAKHEKMREAGRYVGGSRKWDWIYGTLAGYGYRPWLLLNWVLAVWLVCTLAYWAAVNPQWFGSRAHLLAPVNAAAAPADAEANVPYREFFAPAYSAEVLLPVINLGSKAEWKPVVSAHDGSPLLWGWALRFLYWFEIAFGWLAGLLLIGAIGTLIKKE